MVLKIGSIIELVTSKGYAYVQYTHNKAPYGHLIRVLRGLYDTPQNDLEMLAQKTSLFSTFFALPAAIKSKLVKNIGTCTVPEAAQIFPLFKQGFEDPKTNKVYIWNFWDGENRWSKSDLDDREKNASLIGYPSYDVLVSRIERQWSPGQDFAQEVD